MSDILLENNTDELKFIAFKLGNEEYGMPISSIQEIIVPQKYTRIPKSPYFIKGVINLRGSIIPIIDGRVKFNINYDDNFDNKSQRIMIVECEEETVGLIVDSVAEVIKFQPEQIEPPPMDLSELNELFSGIGKYNDRLIILLNCVQFLSINDSKQVEALNSLTKVLRDSKAES